MLFRNPTLISLSRMMKILTYYRALLCHPSKSWMGSVCCTSIISDLCTKCTRATGTLRPPIQPAPSTTRHPETPETSSPKLVAVVVDRESTSLHESSPDLGELALKDVDRELLYHESLRGSDWRLHNHEQGSRRRRTSPSR